jgi:hypothetical protein
MTQMASLLAVATVFVGLWTLNIYIYSQRRGGPIRETKLPMKEREPKCRGAYTRGGGSYLQDSNPLASTEVNVVSGLLYII